MDLLEPFAFVQVADRLFAPGHFFEASEPAAELVASNSSSVEPQLSHVDQDHVHQNATAVTPQEQRKTRLKTTTRLTSHAPKPLSSQNAPTCTRSVAPPPPSSRALQLSTPQAAPPAAPLKQFAPDMTAQQLTSVTALNTSRNKRCYNEHEVVVIHKNELRPPSPSSRIRKTVTGATKQGREQRAQRRGAMKEEGAATCQQTPVASGSTGSHPMAAGDDDEGYSSPKRSRTGSKSVKWSRALIHDDIATRPPCEPGDSSAGLSSVLAKVCCAAADDFFVSGLTWTMSGSCIG